jgi:hypothetical protein
MQSPETRDEHVVDALLDGGALLEDPIRMAAVLDELRARRAEPRPELRMAVADRLRAAPPRPRRAGGRCSRRVVAGGGGLALAACAIALVAMLSSGGGSREPVAVVDLQRVSSDGAAPPSGAAPSAKQAFTTAAGNGGAVAPSRAAVTAPAPGRLQDYQAWMRLRVTSTTRLSQVAQRAISLTRGFGGYVTRSDVNLAGAKNGTAVVDVHIPIARVQDAIARFSSLGVIVGQHIAVADLQAGYDAAARRAESLRHSLALIEVRLADPKATPEQRVALLAQRERARHALSGAKETASELTARGAYARLDLAFSTGAKVAPVVRHEDARLTQALHRVGGILETAAIGALFAVLLGGPVLVLLALVVLGRRVRRRRRERALLARA